MYQPVNEMQFEEKDEYHFVPNKLGDMTWAKSVEVLAKTYYEKYKIKICFKP